MPQFLVQVAFCPLIVHSSSEGRFLDGVGWRMGSGLACLRWLPYSMYSIEPWHEFVKCCDAVKVLCAGGVHRYVFTRFRPSVVERHKVLSV